MATLIASAFQSLFTYLREHLFRAIVGAIASTVVAAGSVVVVPPTTVEKEGWLTEIREHFGRIVSNRLLVREAVPVGSGMLELYWEDNLTPSIANLQRAVLHTRNGMREEYFFMDGDVEFAYRSANDAIPAEEADESTGDRYYFRRGARVRLPFSRQWMFRWVARGRHDVASDQREFHRSERVVLGQAQQILRVARKSPHSRGPSS